MLRKKKNTRGQEKPRMRVVFCELNAASQMFNLLFQKRKIPLSQVVYFIVMCFSCQLEV